MAAVTTSIRIPEELRDQYDILAEATGRSRNELIVEALSMVAVYRLREIELIQEGLRAADEGRVRPLDDVISEYVARGIIKRDALEAEQDMA